MQLKTIEAAGAKKVFNTIRPQSITTGIPVEMASLRPSDGAAAAKPSPCGCRHGPKALRAPDPSAAQQPTSRRTPSCVAPSARAPSTPSPRAFDPPLRLPPGRRPPPGPGRLRGATAGGRRAGARGAAAAACASGPNRTGRPGCGPAPPLPAQPARPANARPARSSAAPPAAPAVRCLQGRRVALRAACGGGAGERALARGPQGGARVGVRVCGRGKREWRAVGWRWRRGGRDGRGGWGGGD
jgi:hypothetical protein